MAGIPRSDVRMRRVIAFVSALSGVAAGLVALGSLSGRFPLSPEVAAALAVLLAAVALLAPLPTLLAEPADDPSRVVAHLRSITRSREKRFFDGLVGAVAAMDLKFSRVRVPGRQIAAGPTRGRFREVATFYRQIESGRLVILGPGGAGKTVLLLELLIRVLDDRRPDAPVPVRVSLSRWNVSQGLEAWLAAEVAAQNDVTYPTARRLVEAGRVLPMLDGLDEMDPDHQPHPTRAAAVLRHLNAYRSGGRPGPLVLTSRDSVYNRLVENRDHLTDTVTVRLAELDAPQIREQIRRIVTDPLRWSQVLGELTRRPDGPLTDALQLPWRLAMIVSLYEEKAGGSYARDPAQLVGEDEPPARSHLLAQYARALLGRMAGGGQAGTRRAERALNLLGGYLLHNLDHRRVAGGRLLPSVDLVVHQLWPVAGLLAPRVATALLGLVLWLPATVAACWLLGHTDWPVPVELMIVAVAAVFPALSIRSSLQWWPHPRRIVMARLRSGRALTRLAWTAVVAAAIGGLLSGLGTVGFAVAFAGGFGAVFGFGCALAVRDTAPNGVLVRVGAAVGLLFGWIAQLLAGFLDAVGGMVAGVAVGGLALILAVAAAVRAPQATPGYAANPMFQSFVRNDLQTGVTAGCATAVMVFLVLYLSPELAVAPLPAALTALSVGCAIGLGLVADTWRRHVAMLICARGRLPIRLHRLLDRAHTAGLLRRSGIAYQFRHLELRDHFGGQPT